MLVLAQLGASTRARPCTGPLKFIRVSKKGRSLVNRSRFAAIVARSFPRVHLQNWRGRVPMSTGGAHNFGDGVPGAPSAGLPWRCRGQLEEKAAQPGEET